MPQDPVQITSIVVKPDPPQPGQNLTVIVNANVIERIEVRHLYYHRILLLDSSLINSQEGATVDVTVKIGLVKLLQKTFDLCEEAYVTPMHTVVCS